MSEQLAPDGITDGMVAAVRLSDRVFREMPAPSIYKACRAVIHYIVNTRASTDRSDAVEANSVALELDRDGYEAAIAAHDQYSKEQLPFDKIEMIGVVIKAYLRASHPVSLNTAAHPCRGFVPGSDPERCVYCDVKIADHPTGQPVAWKIQEPSGDWTLCYSEEGAKLEAQQVNGVVIPLYAHPASPDTARGTMQTILDGNTPRPLGKRFRSDGVASKHDWCIHNKPMYDECENCTDAFLSAALSMPEVT